LKYLTNLPKFVGLIAPIYNVKRRISCYQPDIASPLPSILGKYIKIECDYHVTITFNQIVVIATARYLHPVIAYLGISLAVEYCDVQNQSISFFAIIGSVA